MKLGWLVMAPSERSCGGKSAAIMTRARTFAVSMSRSQRTSVCKARCFFAIHGFEVTPAATVAEALAEITSQQFDVLIADLNIGQPGDGFTVVSAMRRTQPDCVTFILTGYPALETALQAIRSQVDDYAIKPADIPELVATIKERLKNRTRNRVLPTKRLSNILRDHVSEIVERTLEQMKSYSKMGALALPGEEWADAFSALIQNLAVQPTSVPAQVLHAASLSGAATRSNAEHCAARCSSGCDVVTLMDTVRLLERSILDLVHKKTGPAKPPE